MSSKLISILIMVVIGLALLPVVAGFVDDVQQGVEIEGSYSEASYDTSTVYDLDFDATEGNLSETDITIDGTLYVENGEAVGPNDTYEYAGTAWTLTTSEGDTLVLDTDADTADFTGTWPATDGFEITYIDYDEPSTAISSLVGILPVIYVVVMIAGTVTYIGFSKK